MCPMHNFIHHRFIALYPAMDEEVKGGEIIDGA